MHAEQPKALYNLSEFYTWRTAILRSEIPALTKFVLLVLSCHMNEVGGSCFPSVTTLSNETGMDRKTVIKHLRKAIELGWLKKATAGLAGKKWRRNTYEARVPDKVVEPVHQLVHNSSQGGGTQGEGGGGDTHKVVEGVHSSSSVNYPYNYPEGMPTKQAKALERLKDNVRSSDSKPLRGST